MENSTKIALLAGGSFLAGASVNGYLTKRDERRKEAERKERRTRERLESQAIEIDELRNELSRLKGSKE